MTTPARRKRIGVDLLVLSQFNYTGIVTYTDCIVPSLIQSMPGYDWVLFTKSEDLVRFDYEKFPQVQVEVTSWMKSPWLWKLAGVNIEPWRHDLDLLFIPVSRAPFLKTCSVIAYLHDLGFLTYPKALLRGTVWQTRVAVKHAALTADAVLTNSEFTRREICSAYGLAPERVPITHYGFWPDKFNQTPSDHSAIERVLTRNGIRAPYVLYLGNITGRKNLVRLIEASEIWRRTDPSLQLVLAGRRGWNCDEIYAAAAKFSSDQVILPGAFDADDLKVLYQMAECFVLPSLYEGFGIVVIEAMACGAPVILARATVLPEVGQDAALYVDPESPLSIAEAILELRASDDVRRNLIRKGLARASQFTWDACAKRTASVIETVLQEHK
jgi:glycosyltransferase involved in cell wall biosynthesis